MPGEILYSGNHLLQAILDHTAVLTFIKDRAGWCHLISGASVD